MPRSQVVVVPLRVNVNLKAVTLEDLVERRKVLTPFPFPRAQLVPQ
jgi:hypothetical protein